jgi:hypothetical protein
MSRRRVPAAIDPAHVTEKGFQGAVVDYAELMGWLDGRTWIAIHSPYGEPDLRLLRMNQDGCSARLIWAELKTMTGQPTGEQYEWLERGRFVPGVECYLWRPNDWPEIQSVLAW